MAEPNATKSQGYADSDLLDMVKAEMAAAIGFDNTSDLQGDRERALNYYKGVMPDVPALENRSKAVASDVADAIETALPDLVEIFVGGDDVLAFTPNGPEDEDASEQETDYLKHVIFNDNDGFMLLYTAIKDALLCKTGVWTWWWEEKEKTSETKFTGKNAVEAQMAAQDGEIKDFTPDPVTDGAEPTYSFTLVSKKDNSRAKIMAVPPEDFAVADDTVTLAADTTTYCAMRARPRAQDLIAEGVPADVVARLPTYTGSQSTTAQARDSVGESEQPADESYNALRQVEVIHHFLRLVEGEESKLWCIRTDSECTVLIDKEEANGLNFAAITPYPVPHRFHGRSMADLLTELQRINTVLLRTMLDSCYFALNQRYYIDESAANDFTVSDLLRQEPGMPVRGKGPGAVTPLQAGALNFDPYAAMEFMATVGERRTGIVRNAQGLNPDTLHDTASGAMALMAAAQKRLRMIARIIAETGLKDLYLGVHALIRENASSERIVRLRNKWVPVDPTKWGERNDMTIEIGLGASGKDYELAMAKAMSEMMEQIVAAQGGPGGPIVTPEQIYNLAKDTFRKMGAKKVDQYLQDPAKAQPQPPKPDPDMAKVQQEGQIKQAQMQQDAQLKTAQLQQEGQIKQGQQQADSALQAQRLQAEMELKKYQTDQELILKRETLSAELQLKREQMAAELELQRELGHARVASQSASVGNAVQVGGQPG